MFIQLFCTFLGAESGANTLSQVVGSHTFMYHLSSPRLPCPGPLVLPQLSLLHPALVGASIFSPALPQRLLLSVQAPGLSPPDTWSRLVSHDA